MQKPIDDYKEYIEHDILGHLPHITSKKMFGGYSFYQDGIIFAVIIDDDAVCFKADDVLRPEYESAGATQWVYHGHKHKKPTVMPYWQVPEAVLEDRELVTDWVKKSVAASIRTKK